MRLLPFREEPNPQATLFLTAPPNRFKRFGKAEHGKRAGEVESHSHRKR